jgi:TIR domain
MRSAPLSVLASAIISRTLRCRFVLHTYMPSAEVENWLREQGGYEHHCFVSWPHTQDDDLTDLAETVQAAIQKKLAASFARPAVFLDKQISGGDDWEKRIQHALCRSISMVAICAPIYYRPEHIWCGREWAAMEKISDLRLRGKDFKTIIPLMYRDDGYLPASVSKIQPIDVSRVINLGRRYYSLKEFREKVLQIVTKIERIAETLCANQTRAECEAFQFPQSAFLQYSAPNPTFPYLERT